MNLQLRYLASLSSLVFMLLLSGCATMGADKMAIKPQGTKVAVVSLMGNQMHIQHVGTTVFTNQKRDVDVEPWGIDQQIEDKANALISASNKFSVVKAQLADYRQQFGSLEQNFWTGNRKYPRQAEAIKALAAASDAELVVMITPAEYGDVFFSTNQQVSGYGIYQRSFLFSNNAINFMTMTVHVVDANTGEEIATASSYLSSKRLEKDWIEGESLPLTPDNEMLTKAALLELSQGLLAKQLAELNLAH